ncbi:unnamed protein product [Darwinula stevensoni]|uniref:Uncharacterized protein n=1 Tax=Darwinula stevensoni TaxID=69355 RepID=A0A7R9A7Q6_9CRUS|nr:unnamed protein product [Darwinula stevensoni]CAG0894480.1 unnamed protein product [Darwinula stevensoni]
MNSFVLFSFLLTGVLCQDLDESSELDDVVFVFPAGLGVCNATQVAATITRQYTGPPHNRRIHQETQTTCFCPQWRHWVKIPPNTQQEVNATIPEKHDYACAQLNVCREREKCGNMRTDFFSTYYHCTCPMNHLCITEGRDRAIVSEMHYQGPAFQSVCTGHE